MALSAEEYTRVRTFLLAHSGPAAESDVAGYVQLAHLSHEGAELLASAVDAARYGVEPPTAHDIAAHHRRRAHTLLHLSVRNAELDEAADLAIAVWQNWEDRATEEAVRVAAAHR